MNAILLNHNMNGFPLYKADETEVYSTGKEAPNSERDNFALFCKLNTKMPTTVEDVTAKAEMIEIEPKSGVALKTAQNDNTAVKESETKFPEDDTEKVKLEAENKSYDGDTKMTKEEGGDGNGSVEKEVEKNEPCNKADKEEQVPVEVEPKTGVSFPVKLPDGKELKAVGLRKKSMLGMGIKIYGFGIYADDEKLKDLLRTRFGKPPSKPTKEMFQMVIDSDFGMMVRLVIVFSGLTMNMVKKNFDEGLGASIKKLTGGKNDTLTKRMMGEVSDSIKLTTGSVIEITRLPGYTLQTKVMGEIVSMVESELLCRAYMYLYLGEEPFDKEAKERFGTSLLSLF